MVTVNGDITHLINFCYSHIGIAYFVSYCYKLNVATLTLGSRPRQRGYKVVGQEEAWESCHIFLGVLESVREYEGVNPHTLKATPTLGDGVWEDFRNFRERFQGSKFNVLWRSLYH